MVSIAAVLMGFLLGHLTAGGRSAGGADEALPVEEDALLADVRGEDVVRRLQSRQAAMRHEMAWLRKRWAEGQGVLPAEVDLARMVREVEAEYAALEGLARLLQAGQARLYEFVSGCEIRIASVGERLEMLERAVEGN